MKTNILFLTVVFFVFSCGSDEETNNVDQTAQNIRIESPLEIRSGSIAVINVNIIPMTQPDLVLSNQTIVIENGLISSLGSSNNITVPAGAEVIDAKGEGYLIPGLTDMHFHRSTVNDLFLFVANGVTAAREMWGSTGMLTLRDQILDENADLPHVFVASPGMNGPGGAFEQFTDPVITSDEARELVRQYVEDGFDFIKVYNKLEPDVYDAILDESKMMGIRVVGHVPAKIDPSEVYGSGQVSVEHFLGFGYYASSSNSVFSGNLNANLVNELAEISVENGIQHIATMTVGTLSPENVSETKESANYELISDNLKNSFEEGFFKGFTTADESINNYGEVIMALKNAGSKLLLGTDAGFGYVLPGFSIHTELAHHVDAGLSNYEALEAATVNAAEFLEMRDILGTVEVGKRADLVLLESNPLIDISSTDDRGGVFLRGTWLSEQFLRNELENNKPN